MFDGRSKRKAKVIPFIDRIERERKANLQAVVHKAKLMRLEGFETIDWSSSEWQVTEGRLIRLTGKNVQTATFNFSFSPKLGSTPLEGDWSLIAKALFILRFHRKHQASPNQRSFITALGYVAYVASNLGQSLSKLTPEALDNACVLIAKHYSESTAYNLHKHVAEFAAHCDANGLCRSLLQYKFFKINRPLSTGGLAHSRLDDPNVLEMSSDKVLAPRVFRIIGELYLKVPKEHKYRFYVLLLTLLACTGRRFSEVALLPYQKLAFDDEGQAFIEYFPRKASRGEVFTPKRKLYLPTATISIIKEVFDELEELTATARSTAEQMQKMNGPDLRFLDTVPADQRLYAADLKELGISPFLLNAGRWLRENGLAWPDEHALTKQGIRPRSTIHFTNREGVRLYCERDFSEKQLTVMHIDQFGKEYYLKDMFLLRHQGISSGIYAFWLATSCTQSMLTLFLRYLPDLVAEYTSKHIDVEFTSHHFRHTLNTLLDEGGLSDLLQTEWFGRTNPRDTKAYQHTSPEKRVLMLRRDIKEGLVGGQLAEQIKAVPVQLQDAVLKARVQAVHDVGTGICIHNFSQTPCERHLQCSADCKDYVWVKDDKGRVDELKRQYALTVLARQTAEKQSTTRKPKKSADWLNHNNKKLKTLVKQLKNNGIEPFDAMQYLQEVGYE